MNRSFASLTILVLFAWVAGGYAATSAEVQSQHGKHKMGGMPAESGCASSQTVPSLRCAQAPSAAFGRDGRLMVAWVFGGHVYLSRSDDKGASFAPPVAVNNVPEPVSARGENRPKVALDDANNVYISWTSPLPKRFSGNIRFTRSRDGGRTFDAPVTVNDNRQIITHRFEALGVSADGRVHLAWLDKRDKEREIAAGREYKGAALYYTQMAPGATAFKPNTKIIDHTCECCRVAMALNTRDAPVIMWRHIYGDNYRDHGLVSFDSPDRPGVPIRVSHDQWKIDACPHHGPSLSVNPQNTYHAVWFDNAPDSHGLFYARSTDGGKSFLPPTPFGDYDKGAAHPYVIAGRERVYVAWKEFDGKQTQVMFMLSRDNGVSWGEPQVLSDTAGGSDHPLLVSDGRDAYLSWQTDDEGYRLTRIGSL